MTGLGAVGAGYSLSWIAGLSVGAPSPAFSASGPRIVAAFAGHGAAVATQFALTEGLPAVARFALASGLPAAIISVLQFGLGLVLATTSSPGTAQLAYTAVNRMDGGKMLALAVSITVSGVAYLLLLSWLAAAAGPALVLLLIFITGCGIMIGMQNSAAARRDR